MIKVSDVARFLGGLLILGVVVVLVFLRLTSHKGGPGAPHAPPGHAAAIAAAPAPPPTPSKGAETCVASGWETAAAANSQSLVGLAWTPFGRPETGWTIYAPVVAREIATRCAPDSAGFAAAYAPWQKRHGLPADGVFKAVDFHRMLADVELRRPFVQQTSKGICPAAPPETALATAQPGEVYGGRAIQLRAGALAAYRAMVAAARAQGLAAHGELMKLVSGYRGPAEEAARCADGGCNKYSRAHCSAHRTGLALDLYLDHLPGVDPTSTDEANRAAMARSPEYRWMVTHAGDFGFLPYPFEPWHWEWTGEPP